MSREERRQYQRMMKNMDRGPALPPAARARAERNAARRARRGGAGPAAAPGSFSRRFWIVAILLAVALGYVAFSLQWPQMPQAAYVGLAVATVVLVAAVGTRYLQRRAARKNSATSN